MLAIVGVLPRLRAIGAVAVVLTLVSPLTGIP
jgi:hypothetical protein